MTEYKQGIENIPLRHINKSTPALVIVYDLRNNDKVLEEKAN